MAVGWLVDQGFSRVLVSHAAGLTECVRQSLGAKQVEVIDAFTNNQSLLALLPQVMEL